MGWFDGLKHAMHEVGKGVTHFEHQVESTAKHAVHEVGKGVSHVASGGLIKDVAHATLPPKTARMVDDAVHTANDAQVKVFKDAGNAIKNTAVYIAFTPHPAECAADGADLLPFVGSAVRCTQWAVQAAQHHVGGDTPTNCLGNLASDVIRLYYL